MSPKPTTPSSILITMIEGDSLLWPGLEVKEILFVGESAEFEHEAGMLEDAIAEHFKPTKPGTYLLYGFVASYSKDYWGEVDTDYSLDGWREATPEDEDLFYEKDPTPMSLEPTTPTREEINKIISRHEYERDHAHVGPAGHSQEYKDRDALVRYVKQKERE